MGTESLASMVEEQMQRTGLSLGQLSDRLGELGSPISTAALSYWRSGRRRPEGLASMDTVERMEEIFGLEPGALTSRVGPSRRRPRPAPLSPAALRYPEIAERLFGELGFDFADLGLVEISLSNTVDVRDGCIDTIASRKIVRATADEITRFPLYLESPRPRREPHHFRVIHGFRLGRMVRDEDGLVQVVEAVLDQPLAFGSTMAMEVAVDRVQRTVGRFGSYEIQARRRIRDLVVWVRFHGTHRPSRAERYGGEDGQDRVDLPVLSSGLHIEANGYGPGKFGIRWEW